MPVARLTKVETWHKCMNCSKKFSSTWWSDLVKHDAPCGFRVFINFTRISAACLAVENGLQLINNKPQASSSEQLLVNIIRDFTHDHCPGSWPAISSDISDLAWISPTWTAVYIIYIYMVVMFAGCPYLTSIWWHHLTSPTIIHQESHASLQQIPHFVKTRMKLIALS